MTLSSIQTSHGKYCLIEPDSILPAVHELGIDVGQHEGAELYEKAVEAGIVYASQYASGVCLGPEVGLDFITDKAEGAGLVLRLHHQDIQTQYEQLPTMIQQWGVAHITNNYGLVKLDVWYNPAEPQAVDKRKLVAEVHEYCQQSGTQLLLVVRIFLLAGQTQLFPDVQLEAIGDMSRYCDLLAIEYPESALAAATITTMVDVPWLVLNGPSVGYDQFKFQLRECLESGASGCIIDSLLWSGLLDTLNNQPITVSAIQKFVQSDTRDRVIELARIVDETGVHEELSAQDTGPRPAQL